MQPSDTGKMLASRRRVDVTQPSQVDSMEVFVHDSTSTQLASDVEVFLIYREIRFHWKSSSLYLENDLSPFPKPLMIFTLRGIFLMASIMFGKPINWLVSPRDFQVNK